MKQQPSQYTKKSRKKIGETWRGIFIINAISKAYERVNNTKREVSGENVKYVSSRKKIRLMTGNRTIKIKRQPNKNGKSRLH